VRQCISKFAGLTSNDGGQAVKAERARRRYLAARDERYKARCGCTYEQWKAIPARARLAYNMQRRNARERGIGWHITLWDWWAFWQRSGKWHLRGRGRGYMMCRVADAGGYEPGNIYIATGVHNGTIQPNNPYRIGHPRHAEVMAAMVAKLRARRADRRGGWKPKYSHLPVGVTVHKGSGRYVAQICTNGKNKYLGSFKTPEEARAAYVAAIPEQVAA
jgi:hypothetical protein